MNPEEVLDFANKKVKNDTLLVHKAIFRPGAKPTDATEGGEGVASVQHQAAVTATRKYYKVRPGDTLSAIASRHNTTVSKLCQLNGIRPTTTIQAGKQLRVK
jgi:LysM repeat protein